MKISSTTPHYIAQTYGGQGGTNAAQVQKPLKSGDEPQSDSISLSEQTRMMQKIGKAMESEPADRGQYVADIKQQVENKQYTVNAEIVAEKMAGAFMNQFG